MSDKPLASWSHRHRAAECSDGCGRGMALSQTAGHICSMTSPSACAPWYPLHAAWVHGLGAASLRPRRCLADLMPCNLDIPMRCGAVPRDRLQRHAEGRALHQVAARLLPLPQSLSLTKKYNLLIRVELRMDDQNPEGPAWRSARPGPLLEVFVFCEISFCEFVLFLPIPQYSVSLVGGFFSWAACHSRREGG